MIAFAAFDPKSLKTLQIAVDHAWRNLPPDRRTSQIKDRIAKAVMRSAAEGERDPTRLDGIAVAAAADDTFDIEVRQGDQTLSSLRSVELPDLGAAWGHIAGLAEKVSDLECRIRVVDQSGKTLISGIM